MRIANRRGKRTVVVVSLGSVLGWALAGAAQVPEAAPPADDDPRLLHMVLVPAGEFRMGSLEDDRFAESNEKPQRIVYVGDFYIDKLEVTNIEYKRFTDATGYPPPEGWFEGKYPVDADFLPVVNISWWEASAYAKWVGKRLPTETEWEKAARGTDARRFPWGEDFDLLLANSDKDYMPVASYFEGASPYGALNMAGNVSEWTATAYAPYPQLLLAIPDEFGGSETANMTTVTDESTFRTASDKQLQRAREDYEADHPLRQFFALEQLADRRDRVVRGGSINNYSRYLRCANRQKTNPDSRWYNIGFRCAMDPPAAASNPGDRP